MIHSADCIFFSFRLNCKFVDHCSDKKRKICWKVLFYQVDGYITAWWSFLQFFWMTVNWFLSLPEYKWVSFTRKWNIYLCQLAFRNKHCLYFNPFPGVSHDTCNPLKSTRRHWGHFHVTSFVYFPVVHDSIYIYIYKPLRLGRIWQKVNF